jgi:hypothetical protein
MTVHIITCCRCPRVGCQGPVLCIAKLSSDIRRLDILSPDHSLNARVNEIGHNTATRSRMNSRRGLPRRVFKFYKDNHGNCNCKFVIICAYKVNTYQRPSNTSSPYFKNAQVRNRVHEIGRIHNRELQVHVSLHLNFHFPLSFAQRMSHFHIWDTRGSPTTRKSTSQHKRSVSSYLEKEPVHSSYFVYQRGFAS